VYIHNSFRCIICGKNRVFSPQKQIFNLKTVKIFTLLFFLHLPLTTEPMGFWRLAGAFLSHTDKVKAGEATAKYDSASQRL
jgi:hypothetical protein